MEDHDPPAQAKVPVSKAILIGSAISISIVLSCFTLFSRTFADESIRNWKHHQPGIELPERTLAAPQFALWCLTVPGLLFLYSIWGTCRPANQLSCLVPAMGIAAIFTLVLIIIVISWSMLPSVVIIQAFPEP